MKIILNEMKRHLLKAMYISLVILSFVTSLYLIWINIKEIVGRLKGVQTLFKQMSWLSDNQVLYYSLFYFILFAILLGLNVKYLLKSNNNKKVIIFSTLILILFLIELISDWLVFIHV
jgi:hypothetical protein